MPLGMILEEGECLYIHTPKGETIKMSLPAGSLVTAQGPASKHQAALDFDVNLAAIHLA
jgi:hypothetical protein